LFMNHLTGMTTFSSFGNGIKNECNINL